MILYELAQCEHPECIPDNLRRQIDRGEREWDDILCDPVKYVDYASTCWIYAG